MWAYVSFHQGLSGTAHSLLHAHRPLVSPMVRLELGHLHEVGRLTVPAAEILDALRLQADLGVAESHFDRVAARAAELRWTRDPFDRIIAAHALCDDLPLLTKDAAMRERCPVATW